MNVGICIVFYNDFEHLHRLSKAILALDYKNIQVYFTDHHPDKIHAEAFRDYFPESVYEESMQNAGFAAGNNRLAKKAVSDGCKYIWILNPDMEPRKDCLTELVNCLESEILTEAVGPVLLYGEKSRKQLIQFAGAYVDFKTQNKTAIFVNETIENLPKELSQKVDLINGGSLLIKSTRIDYENLFDEEYFMYNDELDLMRRIRNNQMEVRIVNRAVCGHHHDWSKKNKRAHELMYYYMMRNKILYWRKYKYYWMQFQSAFVFLIKLPIIARFCINLSGMKLLYYYYLGLLHGYLGKKGKSDLFNK